ncbi:MAG TPA: hypothetical protein PLX89_14180 [Verrucomicrobiota bacterium]|nr:hypothetical protein [Verrucomicrobiota bacterium]
MAQASAEMLPALKRQLAALRAADERYETTRVERRQRIEQSHQERAGLEKQIAQTPALLETAELG